MKELLWETGANSWIPNFYIIISFTHKFTWIETDLWNNLMAHQLPQLKIIPKCHSWPEQNAEISPYHCHFHFRLHWKGGMKMRETTFQAPTGSIPVYNRKLNLHFIKEKYLKILLIHAENIFIESQKVSNFSPKN